MYYSDYMGIIDKIFGSDDKTIETVSVNNDYIDEYENWNYILKPEKKQLYHGREIYTIDSRDNYWMGEYDRNIVESKKKNPKDSTYIGYYEDENGLHDISIDFDALFRHIALFGQTGYGKSTLMRNMMLQWINGGYGLCYIDPKGHDSKDLVEQIPSHRIDDVEYIDFSIDRKDKISVNLFETDTDKGDEQYETEIKILCEEFINILKQRSDNWDSEINYVIERIIEQQIDTQSKFDVRDSLLDIILNKSKQKEFIDSNNMDKSFVNRLSQLDKSDYESTFNLLRNIEKSPITDQLMKNGETNINISKAVQEGKILIINTSSIHSVENRNLVTQMIISRVWSAIRTRRSDFDDLDSYFLCIDEFQNTCQNYNINHIISQARSFKLSVFVSCQYLNQLPKDTKLSLQQFQSLFSFHPGQSPRDQQEIAQILGDVESWDLGELDRFEIIGRPYMNGMQKSSVNIKTSGEYPKIRNFEEYFG